MKKITLLFTLFAFSFGFSQNGGDDCANSVVALAGSFTGTTINDVTPGTNNGDSAWFVYTATGNGTIDISVCADPADVDTRLFVFDGTCATLNQIANDDDGCPGTFESVLTGVPVVNGTDYYIQWDDRWSVAPFDWTLTFTPPPACGAPTGVVATPSETSSDFTWVAPTIGTPTGYNWEIQPDGVAQGTAGALASGTVVGTTVNSGAVLTASTPYEFYVQTDCGVDGTSTYITIGFTTTAGPPPANDLCSGAIAVSCAMSYNGDTLSSTIDIQGDCGSVDNDAPNVWYSYTGSGSAENVTISTCNAADYDTSLAVYTGVCGALVCYANNDDGPGCAGFSSELTFLSDGTTTYYIMVEGFNVTSVGTFTLSVSCTLAATPPANDTCATSETITLNTAASPGDNTDSTSSTNNPTCDAFGTISDVWYSFVAPAATFDVGIITTLTTATQANVVVWDDCAFTTEVACSDDNSGETVTITAGTLTAGNTYYVQVWNDGTPAEEGTFTVAISSTLSVGSLDNENTFTYFPNPTKNSLTLKAVNEIQNVSIYNMLGQEVLRTAPNAIEKDIDMSSLQTGTYFVQVTINDVTETVRIIKQ